jgi:hypothetical protein
MAVLTLEILICIKFAKGQFKESAPEYVWQMWGGLAVLYAVVSLVSITRIMSHNRSGSQSDDPKLKAH